MEDFIEQLEVHIAGRIFTLEATPITHIEGEDEVTRYAARVIENGMVLNRDNMPQFGSKDEAIQFGFDCVKGLTK